MISSTMRNLLAVLHTSACTSALISADGDAHFSVHTSSGNGNQNIYIISASGNEIFACISASGTVSSGLYSSEEGT